MPSRRHILKTGARFAGIALAASSCIAGQKPSVSRKADYWESMGENVKCGLCPHACMLAPDATGICRVRQNSNGTLITHGYANPCSVHVDPIEKKPLYHVLPGARSFSVAIAGCNLRCLNCQNFTISQVSPLSTRNIELSPEKLVEQAIKENCSTIAYTYSEPSIWFEYMYDTAKLARKAGLKNLWITSGYLAEKPLDDLSEYMDAANIDLKGFDPAIYLKLNGARLNEVQRAIIQSVRRGIWVEITNLLVPQWTDNPDMVRGLCRWIADSVGDSVPVHFSRFYPMHKLASLAPTPTETLNIAKKIAIEENLKFVYIGNVAGMDSDTACPKCKKTVVRRRGYIVTEYSLVNGKCKYCSSPVAGIWS